MTNKIECSECKVYKDVSNFMPRPKSKRGYEHNCRECYNKKQRERRRKSKGKNTKKYERTFNGKLMRTYRNMESRVKGILLKKSHIYKGLPIVSRDEFYDWSKNNKDYREIFDSWVESGYILRKSPSIDRKDPEKGYTLDNMRWVAFSYNCSQVRR